METGDYRIHQIRQTLNTVHHVSSKKDSVESSFGKIPSDPTVQKLFRSGSGVDCAAMCKMPTVVLLGVAAPLVQKENILALIPLPYDHCPL